MVEMPTATAASSEGEPGVAVDDGKGRIFPCESCGADLTFHIGQQTLACPFCGFSKDLTPEGVEIGEQDLDAMLRRLVEQRQAGVSDAMETQEVQCSACYAHVEFTGTLTSTHCPYCGSPIQRERVHKSETRVPVDAVLPFQVERRQAHDSLRKWVKALWFAPNDFKKYGVEGKFEGVYLPFWTLDAMTFNRYSGQRGEYYYTTTGSGKNRRRVRHTRWYPASGEFQRFFDDVLVRATNALPKQRLDALEPWPLNLCRPFNQELLAGYTARTYDIPLAEGFQEGRGRMESAIKTETRQRIGGDTQRIHDIDTAWSALTYKHLLLPVWILAYRFNNRTFQVIVNAATGEVQGDRPWSAWKIFFFVVMILMVIGFFLLVAD